MGNINFEPEISFQGEFQADNMIIVIDLRINIFANVYIRDLSMFLYLECLKVHPRKSEMSKN